MESSAGTRPRSGDVPAAVVGRKVDEGGLILVDPAAARSARLRVSSTPLAPRWRASVSASGVDGHRARGAVDDEHGAAGDGQDLLVGTDHGGNAERPGQDSLQGRCLDAAGAGDDDDMGVHRVVPDFASRSLDAAKFFYVNVLGLRPIMDHGWIVTLADPDRPSAQISLMTHDMTSPVIPDASIEVDDVDAAYEAAVRLGAEIVYPLTDERWGVRRFFVRDPDGHILNVLGHR